jgi:hypothetical protein
MLDNKRYKSGLCFLVPIFLRATIVLTVRNAKITVKSICWAKKL